MSTALLLLLFGVAVVGGTILRWRHLARAGFGLGVVDQPSIVASELGNLAVLTVGFVLLSLPTFIIFLTLSWLAATACLAVGVLFGTMVAALATRKDIAYVQRQRAEFEREFGDVDAITALMKLHLKNGTITQAQFDEFMKTKHSS